MNIVILINSRGYSEALQSENPERNNIGLEELFCFGHLLSVKGLASHLRHAVLDSDQTLFTRGICILS